MNREAIFQGTFMSLHTYGAILAMVALGMHIGAATYHFRQWREAR